MSTDLSVFLATGGGRLFWQYNDDITIAPREYSSCSIHKKKKKRETIAVAKEVPNSFPRSVFQGIL